MGLRRHDTFGVLDFLQPRLRNFGESNYSPLTCRLDRENGEKLADLDKLKRHLHAAVDLGKLRDDEVVLVGTGGVRQVPAVRFKDPSERVSS